MIGFWIFVIIVLICGTKVLCKIIDESSAIDVWKVEGSIYRMEKCISEMNKMLKEGTQERAV